MTLLSIGFTTIVDASTNITPNTTNDNTTIHLHFDGSSHSWQNQNTALDQQANHTSTQTTNATADATAIIKPGISKKLYDVCLQQIKNGRGATTSFVDLLQANKLKTICMTILSSYTYISYQIYRANLIINDPNSWSNWNSSRSLNDLFATSQTKLESDLLFSIQTRYVHPVNPTDFIYSIVQASNSLQDEIKILQEQISRYQWINRCRCPEIFFITAQDLESLQEKHRKLLFLKHIFSSWCANYKIEKNS